MRLYDPLGWLSSTTILAKLEFQNSWLFGVEWNDRLPDDIEKRWLEYRTNLKYIEDIKIPSWLEHLNVLKLKFMFFRTRTKIYLIQAKIKILLCWTDVLFSSAVIKILIANIEKYYKKNTYTKNAKTNNIKKNNKQNKINKQKLKWVHLTIPRVDLCGATLLAK